MWVEQRGEQASRVKWSTGLVREAERGTTMQGEMENGACGWSRVEHSQAG